MNAPIDNLFGIHTRALALWQRRSEVLASNLANADTPGYQARDLDFRSALMQASGRSEDLALSAPTQGQIAPSTHAADKLMWRNPT